MIPSRPP